MSEDEINDMISATAKSIEEKDKVIELMAYDLATNSDFWRMELEDFVKVEKGKEVEYVIEQYYEEIRELEGKHKEIEKWVILIYMQFQRALTSLCLLMKLQKKKKSKP